MTKIQACFTQLQNIVVVQILDMPEAIRGNGEVISTLRRSIRSDTSPQLTSETLFLRGYSYGSDKAVAYYEFADAETARKIIADYTALITDWNQAHVDDFTEDRAICAAQPETTIAE